MQLNAQVLVCAGEVARLDDRRTAEEFERRLGHSFVSQRYEAGNAIGVGLLKKFQGVL